jgi:hypothetical protein
MNQLEMIYSMLHLVMSGAVPKDLSLATDTATKRNVLHWAVLNKQRDLVELLIGKVDADR